VDVCFLNNETPEEGIKTFFEMLRGTGDQCRLIGEQLAKLRDVPYLEEKGKREKDGERKNWPTSFNDVYESIERLSKLAAVYYHYPSMNLVLVDESGEQIGIRSVDLTTFGHIREPQVEFLFQNA